MREPRSDSAVPASGEPADKAAARWALRIADGLTPEQEVELADWLAADSRHERLLAEYRAAWERFDPLAAEARSELADAGRLAPCPRRAPILRFAFPALVAAVTLACGLWWRTSLAPTTATALASLPPPCEQRTLADGSIVELNRGAEIAVEFTEEERHVRLVRGEAAFAVAKDPARPFVVAAGTVAVRAVGTAFNVRLGLVAVEVLVTEGKVAVAPDIETRVTGHRPPTSDLGPRPVEELESRASAAGLLASESRRPASDLRSLASGTFVAVGECMIVPLAPATDAPQVKSLSPSEIEARLAWQSRLLEFDNVPLAVIVAAFNRHNPVTLRIDDDDLAAQRMTASFRSSNVKGFVRLLGDSYGVRATLHADGAITLRR